MVTVPRVLKICYADASQYWGNSGSQLLLRVVVQRLVQVL